jgi:hypothetical protein
MPNKTYLLKIFLLLFSFSGTTITYLAAQSKASLIHQFIQ